MMGIVHIFDPRPFSSRSHDDYQDSPARLESRYLLWRGVPVQGKLQAQRISERAISEMWLGWGNTNWSASPQLIAAVSSVCLSDSSGCVVELGTGLSTLALGLVADTNGFKVTSIDHDAHWCITVREILRRSSIRNVEVIHFPLISYGDFDWYDRKSCLGLPEDSAGRWTTGRNSWRSHWADQDSRSDLCGDRSYSLMTHHEKRSTAGVDAGERWDMDVAEFRLSPARIFHAESKSAMNRQANSKHCTLRAFSPPGLSPSHISMNLLLHHDGHPRQRPELPTPRIQHPAQPNSGRARADNSRQQRNLPAHQPGLGVLAHSPTTGAYQRSNGPTVSSDTDGQSCF